MCGQPVLSDLGRQRRRVEDLYLSLREGVCRYLMACGLEVAWAQEITQEAFLRLYESLLEGNTVEEPKTWIFRVAHNLAVDTFRQLRRAPRLDEAAASDLADGARSVEDVLISRQQTEAFHKIVNTLPLRQRQCLELRIQGLKYREIADLLQVDISTVGESLARAVRRLKDGNRCET